MFSIFRDAEGGIRNDSNVYLHSGKEILLNLSDVVKGSGSKA